MDKFTLLGTQQEDFVPQMITSQTETAQQVLSLVDVLFETNPLDQGCDARVRLNARPLQIIYDAVSVELEIQMILRFVTVVPVYTSLCGLSEMAVSLFFKSGNSLGKNLLSSESKFFSSRIASFEEGVVLPQMKNLFF